jgi:IPT/TIG domain-containing protein
MPLVSLLLCLLAGLLVPALAEGRAAPQVARLEPNNGPEAGGNTVSIQGLALQGESPVRSVTFGGRAASFKVESDTKIAAVVPPGSGEADVQLVNGRGESSAVVPGDRYAYDAPPEGPWLGLNGNSSTSLGPVDAFLEDGIDYDRSGPVEWIAGETLAQAGKGLQASITAGMIPVIPIEYRAYVNCNFGDQCLPTSAGAITAYVRGFISAAREILARYPAAPILLEASNEPWGYGSAPQYAAILASLLPAAQRAHLPMERIYAGATGNGWIKALYAARPQLRTEIKGWYFHPYDKEGHPDSEGVPGLPAWQAEMTSGQNNVIVSELGFCAPEVNGSEQQCRSGPAPARNAAEAAAMLSRELRAAVPFHQAGWLRALLVYSRSDGGWAMQLRGGALTAQGQALRAFAGANP